MGADTDWAIAELSARQHGVVARRQLLDLGIGPDAIGVRLERGSLHRLHLGVYAVGSANMSREGTWMAAVLACGPGAVLSHRSAAACWGVLDYAGYPEVLRPGKFRRRPRIIARFGAVPADERVVRMGIPVTSVPRTILDLADVVSPIKVRWALREAEVRGLNDALSVRDLVHRYSGRRGSRRLAAILEEIDPGAGVPANEMETRFAALLDRHGLPTPLYNHDLHLRGRFFQPDCYWPEHGLVVELDGRAVHGTDFAFERDRERDRILLAEGLRSVRITWRQLRDEPDAIVCDLRNALASPTPASWAV